MAGGGAAGGSLAVAELITKYGDELEADFARYYQLDIRGLFRRPSRSAHPCAELLAHPAAPYVLGTAAGLLVGLFVLAPALAAAVSLLLGVAAPVAWSALGDRSTAAPPLSLTPRRVLALVRHLPHDSATVAAVRGGAQFRGWTADRYLLALIGDLLQNLIYVQVARANPKRKPPKPPPIARPDDQRATPAGNTFAAMAFERLRKARNAKGATAYGNRGERVSPGPAGHDELRSQP